MSAWLDNAVKYLYNRGENDPVVVGEAFVSAARYGFIDTVEFLLGTNRVLPGAVSDAVVVAAHSPMSNIHTMKFLCSKKQATPSSIDRAFVATSSVELLKFLYENECVSDEAIVTVFKNASGWGETARSLGSTPEALRSSSYCTRIAVCPETSSAGRLCRLHAVAKLKSWHCCFTICAYPPN